MEKLDFKRPIGDPNDSRKSTYPGHAKMLDCVPEKANKRHDISALNKEYLENTCDGFKYLTECQDKFAWKTNQPSVFEKPTNNNQMSFVKTFDEKFQNHNKSKPNLISTSTPNIPSNSLSFYEHPKHLQNVDSIKTLIDNYKPALGTLLNPSATTNNLTYKQYGPKEFKASKDIITFWNWKKEFEKKHCTENHDAGEKSYRYNREFKPKVNFVPNRGLISESKSSYTPQLSFEHFDSSHIKNEFIDCGDEVPNDWKSENAIYGSGKRIQNFIK